MNIRDAIWGLIRFFGLGHIILRYHPKSMLVQHGWFNSFQKSSSIDRDGNDIPWLTYPFIHFIEPRLRPSFRVFEYGSGSSTIWYSKRAKEVIAVENNPKWAKFVASKLESVGKGQVILRQASAEYVNEVKLHNKFHIIIIDGVYRQECWKPALTSLLEDGVIIWDNSDREDFKKSFPQLYEYGFRELSFYGMAPRDIVPAQTSLLYRSNNCLEI